MMKLLEHKVALITGGSRGIGAQTAKLFAEQGAITIVNYFSNADTFNPNAITHLIDNIKNSGNVAYAYDADVTDQVAVEQMIQDVEHNHGKISILVVNAFIPFTPKPFIDMEWEQMHDKLVSEVKAAFYITKAVSKSMIENQTGSIVVVSSGLSKTPTYEFCAYTTAKSALNGFVKSLAFELGPHGIRANVVAPGFTLTEANSSTPKENKEYIVNLTPVRRLATPEDIASSILFLASKLSNHITGSYIPVDGGVTML